MSNSTSTYRQRSQKPRRKKNPLDRRESANSSFIKKFDVSEDEFQKSSAQPFRLTEIIDPTEIGKQKFTYDSEKGQDFDATNVKKSREGAKQILADAIEKAKTKAIQIREEARKLGYDEGHKEGFKKGETYASQEFAPLFKAFEENVRKLAKFRQKMFGKVEKEMIEMVANLTKKIICHELNGLENCVKQILRLAVGSVLDKENITIKIHPEDKAFAENFRPELHQLFEEIKNIIFEVNPGLERGMCVIETNFGTIDASLDHLNGQIEKFLNSLIHRSQALNPDTFDNDQDLLSKEGDETISPEAKSQNENIEEKKPEDEKEDNVENDFDFPDLTDPEEKV